MDIYYKLTNVQSIPNNCVECPCQWCGYPLSRKTRDMKLAYYKKRHENCPLVVIGKEGQEK